MFQSFSKAVIVSNFPLKERTEEEMQEIDYITRLRKIEIADLKASKQDKREVSIMVFHPILLESIYLFSFYFLKLIVYSLWTFRFWVLFMNMCILLNLHFKLIKINFL